MNRHPLGATGLEVSPLGFGASPLGNEFGSVDPAECARAVHCAIDLGINFFDTSPYYGRTLSESRLGDALRGRRHQVILSTKCGRYDVSSFDFSASRITASIEESLTRLHTDFVDLWQAHDIEFGDRRQLIEETIPAMRELQRQGKVRFIGITGYQLKMLRAVAEAAPVDTVLSYCRYNLLIDDLDRWLTPFARQHSLGLINASPLHMGLLTDGGGPAWHPAPAPVKRAAALAAEACRARGASVSEIALQFALAHPYVATTLVGMSTIAEVRRNVQAAAGTADPALADEIRAIVAPAFGRTWPSGKVQNEDYAQSAED